MSDKVVSIGFYEQYGEDIEATCLGTADEWIDADVKWHEEHRGVSGKGDDYELGFIAGMKQAGILAALHREASVRGLRCEARPSFARTREGVAAEYDRLHTPQTASEETN